MSYATLVGGYKSLYRRLVGNRAIAARILNKTLGLMLAMDYATGRVRGR